MKIAPFAWDKRMGNWIGLVLCILLFLFLGYWFLPHPPKEYPAFVTDSPSPTGVKGFYTFLQNGDRKAAVWDRKDFPAPGRGNQLMIMVQPYPGYGNQQLQQGASWMEGGNRIWLLAEDPGGLFGLETSASEFYDPEKIRSIVGISEWKGEYKAKVSSRIRLTADKNDQILLKDDAGVLALSRSFGKGELLVSVAPEWLSNGKITRQDNVRLITPFLNRAQSEGIWMNETIHGAEEKGTLIQAYPQWFLLLLAQSLLLVLLWLWLKGRRFGPVEWPREWSVRFSDERIRAIAAWYERSSFYTEALLMQQDFVRQLMQEKWGIAEITDTNKMLSILKHRLSPEQESSWKEIFREVDQVKEGGRLSRRHFLHLSQKLDRIRKEIEKI